jgi:hypothetical protein
MDLARILEHAGRGEDAREALEKAADMYRRKGILVRLIEAEGEARRLAATRV